MPLSAVPPPHNGKFLVAGDWHAHIAEAKHVIGIAVKYGYDTIIHVGDFGFYDNMSFLKETNNLLKKYNIRLLALDGNHEQFPYLYSFPVDPDTGLRPVRSNIFHLPRNTRWEWDGLSYLALGGAQSIDVRFRKAGESWWPEERITLEEASTAISEGHADIMFTHDSPMTFSNPITLNARGQLEAMRYFGAQALADCHSHQELLETVTNKVKPLVLMHGHYHVSQEKYFRHGDGSSAYGISLDQGLFLGNVRHTGTEDLKAIIKSVKSHQEGEYPVYDRLFTVPVPIPDPDLPSGR